MSSQSQIPWWLKSIGLSGISIITSVVKDELHFHYRGKKPHPDTEDELDELEDMINTLEQKLEATQVSEQQKTDKLKSVPKPQTLTSITTGPKIDYHFLFGRWIWEGGITLLFSPTKLGKTTCAVQIANDIASGSPSKMLPDELNQDSHAPQTVLYYDLESDETDFQDRYGMAPNQFSPNLQFIFDYVFDTMDELMCSIEETAPLYEGNVTVVIDNTSMVGDSKYQAKTEMLIKRIKKLQSEFKSKGHLITFILVAHTHKTTDDKIELEDISGSSNFANLTRCILTIEKSGIGNDYRILKLLNTRKKEGIEDGKVIVVQRKADPFLHFEYYATMDEDDALTGNITKAPPSSGNRGPKAGTYTPLTIEQVGLLKAMVDAILAQQPLEIDGMVMDSKHKIAQHFDICDQYVKRYYDGTMKPSDN